MEMKRLLIAMLGLLPASMLAGEYRYTLMATTGLQERIIDKNGVETMISFSADSDPQSRFVLGKILDLGGIHGTKGKEDWRGVPFEQAIILVGELKPEILSTGDGKNTAAVEAYQKFKLEKVLVRFPLVRHREGKAFDSGFLETHFGYDTLFPDGLEMNGKRIDLEKHTAGE